MRIRRQEREQLAGLLEAEHEDVDTLAGLVFRACTGMVLERDWWVIVQAMPTEVMLFGPYAGRAEAQKALPSLEFRAPETRVFIRKLAVVGDLQEGLFDA